MDNRTADALIKRTAGGDMAAFEELYNGLFSQIFAFAMSIVRNRPLAEDITQDVFVKVHEKAPSFTPTGYGVAWIMTITRNLALNAVTRVRETGSEEDMETMRSPERTEDNTITRVALDEAMDALSDDERRIVTLHAVSGLKLEEIAGVMSMSLGTVKWKHAAALKKLRSAVNYD